MKKRTSRKSLLDGYRFPGFRTYSRVKGLFGDSTAIVIILSRRQKKRSAENAAPFIARFTIARPSLRETSAPVAGGYTWSTSIAGLTVECAAQ
jgi:hypothetical protein